MIPHSHWDVGNICFKMAGDTLKWLFSENDVPKTMGKAGKGGLEFQSCAGFRSTAMLRSGGGSNMDAGLPFHVSIMGRRQWGISPHFLATLIGRIR